MKKPIVFLILKIVGILALALAVLGVVLLVKGFGDFESNNYLIGMFLTPFSTVIGVLCITTGFRPEIAKMRAKGARYIQEQNKEDLSAIATTAAEIISEGAATIADAVREEKKFCKHCGASIDRDSKFCSECGKEQ